MPHVTRCLMSCKSNKGFRLLTFFPFGLRQTWAVFNLKPFLVHFFLPHYNQILLSLVDFLPSARSPASPPPPPPYLSCGSNPNMRQGSADRKAGGGCEGKTNSRKTPPDISAGGSPDGISRLVLLLQLKTYSFLYQPGICTEKNGT